MPLMALIGGVVFGSCIYWIERGDSDAHWREVYACMWTYVFSAGIPMYVKRWVYACAQTMYTGTYADM